MTTAQIRDAIGAALMKEVGLSIPAVTTVRELGQMIERVTASVAADLAKEKR
jgi:hypothetical protein